MGLSAATPERSQAGGRARLGGWLAAGTNAPPPASQPASQRAASSRPRPRGPRPLSLCSIIPVLRVCRQIILTHPVRRPLLCLPLHLHPHIAKSLLLRPYRKILKPVCAISNGAWRSHFSQIPQSLSSLTHPSLPRLTLGISPGIAWVSCSCSLSHRLTLHTIHQTMLPVLSHP
jgi:hypothetical protein